MKFGLLSYNDPCTGFFWAVKQLGWRATTIFPMRKVPSLRFLLLLLDAAYFDMPDGSELRLRVPLAQLGGDHVQQFPSFWDFRRSRFWTNTCPPWSCWFQGVYVVCLVQALFTTPCSICENVIGMGSCSTNHSNLHVLHSKSRINLCVSRGSNRYMWILMFGRRYWKPFGLPTCLWLKQFLMLCCSDYFEGSQASQLIAPRMLHAPSQSGTWYV